MEQNSMKRRMAGTTMVLAMLVLPAMALGERAERGKLGSVIAKDSAKDNPAAAAAQVTLQRGEMGKISYRITTVPNRTKVDWGITTRCVKGSLIDYFPGPGDFKTDTKPGGFGGTYPKNPLADPDFCTFAVAGQTYKNDAGKRVTVKIYNKK
jgi:hypothetical protein